MSLLAPVFNKSWYQPQEKPTVLLLTNTAELKYAKSPRNEVSQVIPASMLNPVLDKYSQSWHNKPNPT